MKRLLLATALAAAPLLTPAPARAACSPDGTYTAAQVFAADFCIESEDFTFSAFNALSATDFNNWTFTFGKGGAISVSDSTSPAGGVVFPGVPAPIPGDPNNLNPDVFYGYQLTINDITKQIASVTLDTTGASDGQTGNDYGAVKLLSATPYSSTEFVAGIVQSVFVLESIDGAQANATAAQVNALGGLNSVYVRDFLQTQGTGRISGATNAYTLRDRTAVPGPLGLAGVVGACGWARVLRKRIRGAA